jgi:hypothetical protein
MSARTRPWWVAWLGLPIVMALAVPAGAAAAGPVSPAGAVRAADGPNAEPPDCDVPRRRR